MATLDEIKGKVDHVGDVMDMLSKNYNTLSELVVNQRQEMAEMRQQTAELRTMSANAQKQLDNHQLQLIELRRDSQKTRRLWIAIAQKLDWLDLDEDFD